jgi:hypothetical protein
MPAVVVVVVLMLEIEQQHPEADPSFLWPDFNKKRENISFLVFSRFSKTHFNK